jgi:hypothetical protein
MHVQWVHSFFITRYSTADELFCFIITTTQKVSMSFLKKKCITLPPQKLICRAVIYERFMVNPQNDKNINQNTTPFLVTHTVTLTFKWSRFRSVVSVTVSSISVCRTEKQSFCNCT